MINKHLFVSGVAIAGLLMLAGCHNDDNTSQTPAPPATNMPVAFEAFAQSQIIMGTCTTTTTIETDEITFSFSGDQDDADPRDISGVIPGCGG